ncbi:MAG: histidinol-phosphate transaminase [Proteobacteria bacterium]|nr:histidinol-phosphate transaminase [Pseudomonadota bacterium]
MGSLTRRQILLGGTALAAAGLIPAIPRTPLTPAMKLMQSALAADIPRPDYIVRLGANENPYGPSRVALNAIHANLHLMNRYSADPRPLAKVVAELNGVTTENMVIGTGSGEILNVAGLLASLNRGSIVCADPTYQDLLRYAETAGAEIIRVPVNESLNADLDAMRAAVRNDTDMVYLVNPNNPIPSVLDKNEMREFVIEMSKDRLVFIDEAYHEYVDNPDYGSMIGLIAEGHNNIIVSRTASKIHGLAGMRIGFGFAHPDLATRMNQIKTGDACVLAIEAALASYQDDEFPKFSIRKNKESRQIVEAMCEELGLRYIKSNTNFTFIETGMENKFVQDKMHEYGISTGRDFPPYHTTWTRVSLSKPEEMRYFVQVYKQLFA